MTDQESIAHAVEVHRDIVFGTARVGYNGGAGPMRERALLLDWYEPVDAPGPMPALVLAFGGAFHRGTRGNDVRPEDGPKNTSIADYCRKSAERGYACFSIDYRLTQEDPDPGATPTLGDETVPTSRIDVVRELLGLQPATPQMLRNAQEAAGHAHQGCLLPGQTHFYLASAAVESTVGGPEDLEQAIEQFLARHLQRID